MLIYLKISKKMKIEGPRAKMTQNNDPNVVETFCLPLTQYLTNFNVLYGYRKLRTCKLQSFLVILQDPTKLKALEKK